RHGLRLVAVRQPPHQVKLQPATQVPPELPVRPVQQVPRLLARPLAGGLQARLRVLPPHGGQRPVAAPPVRFAACAQPMSHAVEASAATTAMEIFPAAAATLRVQHVALMKHSRTKNAHAALSPLKPGTPRITQSMPLV